MKKKKEQTMQSDDLRLSEGILDSDYFSLGKIRQMLYGLQTRQLELEMENDDLRQIKTKIEKSCAKYFDLYELAPVGYCTISESGLILESNLTGASLLGADRAELVNHSITKFILKEYKDIYYLCFKELFATGKPQKCELRMRRKDGTEFWGYMVGTIVKNNDYYVAQVVLTDITYRKILEEDLSNEKNLLETTMASVLDGVISTDINGNIVFMNKIAEEMTGWTKEDAKGMPIAEVFNLVDEFTQEKIENMTIDILESREGLQLVDHVILISKDGVERPIEKNAVPIVYDNRGIEGVVFDFRDCSRQRQKQEEISYLSYHDQLTGLYNRRFYEEELKRLDINRNLPLTIMMGDVNGLKLINDSFGHAMGDELLKKVAEGMKQGCRGDDIISRLGGDEFVVILPNTDLVEADKVMWRIKGILATEMVGAISVSVSFGLDTKNKVDENIWEIIKNAEKNMYRKKLIESSSMRRKALDLIIHTLFEKNMGEMLHAERVSEISQNIAVKMNLAQDEANQIRVAGLMHDIGKIGVDEKILNKTQRLNNDERREVERHSEIGYRILSSVNDFSNIADCVSEIHEKWDGNGYPRGLKGEEISLQSRIIAIAEAFDTMTNARCYGKALSEEEAISEIERCSGTQFDPDIIKVFREMK